VSEITDPTSPIQPPTSEAWKPYPHAQRNLTYLLVVWFFQVFFRILGRWKRIGLENVPKTGGVLLTANHASYLDPPLIGIALYRYRRAWFMGKSEMWDNRLLGFINDRVGGFPVRRNSPDRKTLRRVLDWLAAGEAVGMFPEGERTNDGLLHPAMPGIALLVQKSGVPVVPVAVLGTYAMLPRHRKSIKPAPITIAFGKPITFPPDASREAITTAVMQAIADLMTTHGQPTEAPTRKGEE
jgi:1-acyl-sn-glycerol-3-phosphate acyltransferase